MTTTTDTAATIPTDTATATATAPDTRPRIPARHAEAPSKVTLRRVLRSEWSKFWSLRSSWITLLASAAVILVFGIIAASVHHSSSKPSSGGLTDPVSLALTGVSIAGLLVGALGVLLSAGEYGTGMVRSTYVAVPKRWPVLVSKSTVIGLLVFVVATAASLIAFQVGAAALHGDAIALTLKDPGVLRSLVGAGAYLGLSAAFGVALGSLIRSTSGAIAALVVSMMLLPVLATLLPGSSGDSIKAYFPGEAGQAVYALHPAAHTLAPGAGLAVFAGWVAVLLAGAAIRLKRTDV